MKYKKYYVIFFGSSIVLCAAYLLFYSLTLLDKRIVPYVSLLVLILFNFFLLYSFERIKPVIINYLQRNEETLRKRLNEYRRHLMKLSIPNPDKLAEKHIEFIQKFFSFGNCKVLLWKEEEGAFVFRPSNEKKVANKMKWRIFDDFIIWLTEYEQILEGKNFLSGSQRTEVKKSGIKFFRNTEAKLIIPLVLNQSLLGIICLGDKKNNKKLSLQDYEFLLELKEIGTFAFGYAILYENLANVNHNLAVKVKNRTRNLEEAQSKLVQTEKLASLGTMVAGIAHEVNTPAAVIHAAINNIRKKNNPTANYVYRGDSF